jgi:YD repeat-containing protein
MRILQKPEEMQKFKQLKVKEQIGYKLENGQEKPVIHRYYDEKGRLVKEIKGTNRKNFIYDFRNRIIMIQDSVLISGWYDRDEYEFEFDGYGKMSFSRFPYFNSSFEYDPAKNELLERTMMDLDAYRKRYFRFDRTDRDRLIEEEFFSYDGSKELLRKLIYDSQGRISIENLFKFHTNGSTDTATTEYTYDNKGQLVKKVSVEHSLVFPPEFTDEPLIPYHETTSSIYTYFYDTKGNLLEETFAYADNSYGYRIVYAYDNKGLKIKEESYDIKDNLKQSLLYKYKFRK